MKVLNYHTYSENMYIYYSQIKKKIKPQGTFTLKYCALSYSTEERLEEQDELMKKLIQAGITK